ncbi:unnamed protein product [Brassica oleracea var. botrytis]|uniref:(rape) hypothetical protein n=1 Tax=Brassica napus TaxID=3708 RepID=A0A816IUP9_BRANA|nr:unnamed protein product [Brassica napus]
MTSIQDERIILEIEESFLQGMTLLTLSASVPGLKPAECIGPYLCPPADTVQYGVFLSGLYLIALLGTGGIKPCVSSFGADQFDDTDPIERVSKASFFNWFYFFINIGSFVSSTLLVWVQENSGWGLGFMIPTVWEWELLAQDAVSMSIFWQGPQYMLMGIAEVFFFVGRLEFFYEQSPDAMRSLCSALALLNTAMGSYLSSLILTLVAYFTTADGKGGWIPDDLDKGHLDYFFWLLVLLGLSTFLCMSSSLLSTRRRRKKAAV